MHFGYRAIEALQMSFGYRCNQSWVHCAGNVGPNRKEEMTGETPDAVIDFPAASREITAIDRFWQAPERIPAAPDGEISELGALPDMLAPAPG